MITQFKDYLSKKLQLDLDYFVKGGFWMVLSSVVVTLLNFGMLYVLTNFASEQFYVSYKTVLAIIEVIYICTLPGLTHALMLAASKNQHASFNDAIRYRFFGSLLGSVGMLFVAAYFAFVLGSGLWNIFVVIALIFPFTITFRLALSYLTGLKKFAEQSQLGMLERLLILGATVIAVLVSESVLFVLATQYAMMAAVYGGMYLLVKRVWYKHVQNKKRDTNLLRYSIQLTLIQLPAQIAMNIDKLLVVYFLGVSKGALFYLASSLFEMSGSLSRILFKLLLPKFGELSKQNIVKKVLLYTGIVAIVGVFAGLVGFFIVDWIIPILFPKYIDVIPYVKWLILFVFTYPTTQILYARIVSQKDVKGISLSRIGWPVAKIVLSVILIPLYGIVGAVAALALSHLIKMLLVLYVTIWPFSPSSSRS